MFLIPVKHIKYNFAFDFFIKRQISPFYEGFTNLTNNKKTLNNAIKITDPIGNVLHEVKNIPSYFSLNKAILNNEYKVIKYNRIENFIINLLDFSDVNEYLKDNMTPKNKKKLETRKNRLETCFKITYRSYYGDISEKKYKLLFHELKKLIERRFKQRGDKFYAEDKWNYFVEGTYKLILDKKASFYVIYDDEKPIHIGLMYHFQNIVQSVITSYDIDYSKFGIGHIAIFKKIEWCFVNNFNILDLMWGGTIKNKIIWCNDIQKYEHQFIYKNNEILKPLYANLFIQLYKIKDWMDKNSRSFKKIKRSLKQRYPNNTEQMQLIYKVESLLKMPLSDSITKINLKSDQYAFLRKPVYDFQYLNFESSNNLDVFKEKINDNTYFIKGTKSQIKILINRN